MAKIRHLAIKTENPGKLAAFYKEVFGLEELHRPRGDDGPVYLTDGYFNLAILPNTDQQARNGLYHFGFHVDSADEVIDKIRKMEVSNPPKSRPKGRPYAEMRASDPDGNFFDISEHGFQNVDPLKGKEHK
jgi:catechol 2,3-dioxygenase-like lactoylglutathione lyase family enzyme